MRIRSRLGAALTVAVVLLAVTQAARADTGAFLAAVKRHLPLVAATERAASTGRGGPEAVQAQYDAARDFVEALEGSLPIGASCLPAYEAARAYARAQIAQTEGFDRVRNDMTQAGLRKARRAADRYNRARESCRDEPATAPRRAVELTRPRSGEIVFGSAIRFEGRAPRAAGWAVATADGSRPDCGAAGTAIVAGRFRATLAVVQGRHDVAVAFCGQTSAGSRKIAEAAEVGVWVLPSSASAAVSPRRTDAQASFRLTSLARGFPGFSAVWFHDLATGRSAGWNADARFPAASTVKLALLVAALERFGPASPVSYDIAAMATWSSNLATNRLLVKLGGSEEAGARIAQAVLSRLGAGRSTFTGGYRVGTSVGRPAAEPPLVSARVTTARDLGRILYLIHAGATGDRRALSLLRLDRREAHLALSLLLSSEPTDDNVGLFRRWLGPAVPAAQKHGWFSAVRHSAAIVYTPSGPKIVVLLAYRNGLSLGEAQGYAAKVLRVLGL